VKQSDRIGAAADAGDDHIRQRAGVLEHLRARLAADDRLQLAHQVGIGMAADRRAEQVVGVGRIGHPVAQRLVDRRAQRAITAGHRHHLGAQQPHAADVGRLALHVHLAHVHRARQADARTGGGAGDAVLAGAGLRHDAPRAEPPRQQRLAERVVDLVRTGVREVLALEPDLRAPALRQVGAGLSAVGRPTQSRSSRLSSALKLAIRQPAPHAALQPLVRRDQRLRHIASAERAVAAALVRVASGQQIRQQRIGALMFALMRV
jgi:hypothetical protein